MIFKSKTADPHELLAKGKYKAAVEAFRKQLNNDPENIQLRLRFSDALLGAGDKDEGVRHMIRAAEMYAEKGFAIKAVALQNKILRLDPSREESLQRLAELIGKGGVEKAPRTTGPVPTAKAAAAKSAPDESKRKEEAKPEPRKQEAPAAEPMLEVDADTVRGVRRVPLFSELPVEEFKEFVKGLKRHEVAAGNVVVREGTPGKSMYIISSGSVRVLTKDAAGGELHLTDLHEGDFFGEGSLLKGIPRTATIVSLDDAELLELTKEELDRMAKKYPTIIGTIETFYMNRVTHTVETMKERLRSEKGA